MTERGRVDVTERGRVDVTILTMAAAMFRAGWRQLQRDRTALAFTVLVPVGVALVLGAIYTSTASGTARIGVVVQASGPVGDDLAERLEASPVLETVAYPDAAALDRAVLHRDVEAGVVIPVAVERLLAAPAGSAAPDGAGAGAPVRLVGAPGVQAPGGLRAAIEAAAADTSAVAALARTEAPDDPAGLAFEAARARLGTGAPAADGATGDAGDHGDAGDQQAEAAGFAVVATLVLFVFTNTAAGSADWVARGEWGVLTRLRTTPASAVGAVLGFGGQLASYALVQAVVVLVAGRLLFGVPIGAPGPLALALVAVAVAAAGLGLLLATVLPSSGAGNTIAGPLAFIAGMVGGCLWPLEIAPPPLAALGRLMPQFWAVEALRSAVVLDDGFAGVAGPVGVLALFGLIAGGAAVARLARLRAGTGSAAPGRVRARLGRVGRSGRRAQPVGV